VVNKLVCSYFLLFSLVVISLEYRWNKKIIKVKAGIVFIDFAN